MPICGNCCKYKYINNQIYNGRNNLIKKFKPGFDFSTMRFVIIGGSYSGLTAADCVFKECRAIEASHDIAIIGAGPTGIEVAGEIQI